MTDETENGSVEDANDNIEPSVDDTPDEFDYFDPDEDQDNEEAETAEGTDDETDEVEAEDEAEDQEDEDPQADDPDKVTVTLDDGTTVPLSELKSGYFRQADYSRKTAELATTRKAVEADTQRITGITQAFVDHIASMLPPEPSPSLALSDPSKYTAQKAQYDAATAQIQKLIELGESTKEVSEGMNQADRQKLIADENQKLVEMFPVAGTAARKEFFEAANSAAADLGFSTEELGAVTDHRMIALAHWAHIGKQSVQAKAKAKAKVQQAPPATPRKPGSSAKAAGKNVNAMRKLSQSGSIHDALSVDFD